MSATAAQRCVGAAGNLCRFAGRLHFREPALPLCELQDRACVRAPSRRSAAICQASPVGIVDCVNRPNWI